MKKVMAALLVTMCVVMSIGMGPKEALADTQLVLKQRVVEMQLKEDEDAFFEELADFASAAERYLDVCENCSADFEVEHVTHYGINDVSFVLYGVNADGEIDALAYYHETHESLNEYIANLNAAVECETLSDWM